MSRFFKSEISWKVTLLLLSITIFIIYWTTGGGATPYDYFTRLANSFLQGKYYLSENPGWLNELIPIGLGRFAVVYPPGPAIISIPFIIVFGPNFQQQVLAQIMGAFGSFIWGLIAYKKSISKLTSLWVFLLASLGNIVWYLSSNGSVWYLGQVSAYLFITLTIYESIYKKRLFLIIFYFGMACISRLQVVLAFPLILYLNLDLFRNIKKIFSFLLGISFFGIVYGIYNYLRFGSFLQTGYSLIPGVLSEPWYSKGIFNYSYAISNLKVMFTSLPIFKNDFPYITPSWGGLAIWITSPAFIYALFANLKNRVVQFSWISLILIAIVVFFHGGTGFTQFGYRYAVDFYPLIIFLIIESIGHKKLKWHHWILLILSILVNLWGVLWINKFDWVSF